MVIFVIFEFAVMMLFAHSNQVLAPHPPLQNAQPRLAPRQPGARRHRPGFCHISSSCPECPASFTSTTTSQFPGHPTAPAPSGCALIIPGPPKSRYLSTKRAANSLLSLAASLTTPTMCLEDHQWRLTARTRASRMTRSTLRSSQPGTASACLP